MSQIPVHTIVGSFRVVGWEGPGARAVALASDWKFHFACQLPGGLFFLLGPAPDWAQQVGLSPWPQAWGGAWY